MWLFRKSLDLSRASVRPVTAADITAVSRLLRDGGRRYYGLTGGDLTALLAAGQGVALDAGDELWGVALASLPIRRTSWLRAVALAEGVEVRAGVEALVQALHRVLLPQSVTGVFFAGDESAEEWLLPALTAAGYRPDTEVIVYEKLSLAIPDAGNQAVRIQPAGPVDLPAVLHIDEACFETHWTKDDTVLGPALDQGPYFVLAELDGEPVGYAYATTHFGGRLVHLVRIAVLPAYRGRRIAARLLADLVSFADEVGASTITLTTQAYNTHAQRLYRWFGFVATGESQPVLHYPLT